MIRYLVQPEEAIGRIGRKYVEYMIWPLKEDDGINICMQSTQDAEVLDEPPEGANVVEAEWGGHYGTANKMIAVCRGLYELGYFDIESQAVVYIGYGSGMHYVDNVSVYYKKGKVSKFRLPKMRYYAAAMFMYGYDEKYMKEYDLRKFKDLIYISMGREVGEGLMRTF